MAGCCDLGTDLALVRSKAGYCFSGMRPELWLERSGTLVRWQLCWVSCLP